MYLVGLYIYCRLFLSRYFTLHAPPTLSFLTDSSNNIWHILKTRKQYILLSPLLCHPVSQYYSQIHKFNRVNTYFFLGVSGKFINNCITFMSLTHQQNAHVEYNTCIIISTLLRVSACIAPSSGRIFQINANKIVNPCTMYLKICNRM